MQHEAYPDVGLSLMEAMVGTNRINQVFIEDTSQSLEKALSAPLTQFIYVTMRPLHDREYELVPLIKRLQAEVWKIPGCISSCWGPSVEKDKLQIGIVGWTSLEVCCPYPSAITVHVIKSHSVGSRCGRQWPVV